MEKLQPFFVSLRSYINNCVLSSFLKLNLIKGFDFIVFASCQNI